ncbi:MAG: glycoside hydrolase family 5 protein, partial [Fibrobacter sp.]|nr:glycoside hydrolase family 5 protein [Fibrobacter sp.]
MFGSKVLGVAALSLALAASAFGRVGPVSQYGQLQAGKNSSGKGQIYGACKGVTSGNEVQVQGMSLFWSISSDVGSPFWTADYVKGLVDKQNIQIIRAPMGVDEDWGSGNYFTNKDYYQGLMNTVVQAAIDNDIYVIIDYHSHKASDNVNNAKDFFGYMAQKWGKYDNVIFEVFNEPISQSWGTIKTYADQVISEIRKYSDNLIVVGNRSWDQYPNEAISAPISDKNVAYTFHYYAGSHYTNSEGANAVQAMNAGLSVFVTEWGTVNADGDGGVSGSNSGWLSWMNQHKLSGANWAVSNKNEGASYFSGSAWNYSESGQWVNTNIFSKLPKSYSACSAGGNTPASSSSVASSSSSLPAGYTDYIDDFEDGDSLAFTGGIWYAYNDNENGAASSF